MSERSIILVGNPDTGKTNFLGRLWLALQTQKFGLIASHPPSDIKYVEEIAAHILQGKFVPRTDKEDNRRDFNVSVRSKDDETEAKVVIPDVSGEMWKKAVEALEISEKWMEILRKSSGALLFVRVLSDLNVQPLDWVNCQEILKHGLVENDLDAGLPTQISLIELMRFLEENLTSNDGEKPKVAVIVSAWDMLNDEDAQHGPNAYIRHQFPMFAGRIMDSKVIDIKIFGLSIVGGDLSIEDFMQSFLEKEIDKEGYVVSWSEIGGLETIFDITAPVRWLLK